MPTLDPLALTRDLLRFDTVNPPGQERACARHLGSLLESAGFAVDYHEYADTRTSLVARIGGADERAPICFTGHIDVVPLGTAPWTHDPFAGETDGPRLFGRGSSDMKSGVAAFVVALVDLAPHLRATPGVTLVITAGEETGCAGANHLLATPGALGRAGAIVVAEPTGNYPLVGHKGAYWLKAVAHGVTAHGSMPELGDNALFKAARAVSALESYRFDTHPHPMMGLPSLNVGTMHGGLNINSVPDEATIGIDIRTIPNQDHEALRAHLARTLGADIELQPIMDVPSVWTEPNEAWVQRVFDTVTPYLGERPRARTATYFTDAAALRAGYGAPPTLILGPGEPQTAHQIDEYCRIDRLEHATAFFTDIARDWCGI
jgi:succinyl-diaminopimelate desuccinylase